MEIRLDPCLHEDSPQSERWNVERKCQSFRTEEYCSKPKRTILQGTLNYEVAEVKFIASLSLSCVRTGAASGMEWKTETLQKVVLVVSCSWTDFHALQAWTGCFNVGFFLFFRPVLHWHWHWNWWRIWHSEMSKVFPEKFEIDDDAVHWIIWKICQASCAAKLIISHVSV